MEDTVNKIRIPRQTRNDFIQGDPMSQADIDEILISSGFEVPNEKDIMENRIAELEDKLSRVQSVLDQLLGGLFHEKRQHKVLYDHLGILWKEDDVKYNQYEYEYESKIEESGDDESWWPTTRQSNNNCNRIYSLEERVKNLEGKHK